MSQCLASMAMEIFSSLNYLTILQLSAVGMGRWSDLLEATSKIIKSNHQPVPPCPQTGVFSNSSSSAGVGVGLPGRVVVARMAVTMVVSSNLSRSLALPPGLLEGLPAAQGFPAAPALPASPRGRRDQGWPPLPSSPAPTSVSPAMSAASLPALCCWGERCSWAALGGCAPSVG